MLKKEKLQENWVLFALINASERYGINLDVWYSKRPSEMDLDFQKYIKLIKKMEKDGLIKGATQILGNHILTKNGHKKAIKNKRKMKFVDYYSFITKFPEIELRERIETIESFLISAVLFTVAFLWGQQPIYEFGGFPYLKEISLFIFTLYVGFSALFFTLYSTKVFLFWTMSFKRDTYWVYSEWFWNNKKLFIYPLPAIAAGLGIYFSMVMNFIDFKGTFAAILFIVIGFIVNHYYSDIKIKLFPKKEKSR